MWLEYAVAAPPRHGIAVARPRGTADRRSQLRREHQVPAARHRLQPVPLIALGRRRSAQGGAAPPSHVTQCVQYAAFTADVKRGFVRSLYEITVVPDSFFGPGGPVVNKRDHITVSATGVTQITWRLRNNDIIYVTYHRFVDGEMQTECVPMEDYQRQQRQFRALRRLGTFQYVCCIASALHRYSHAAVQAAQGHWRVAAHGPPRRCRSRGGPAAGVAMH